MANQETLSQEEFSIDVINVRKGLLSNFVTKVVSDENNLKFFATEGGISKYDGYNFTDFRPGEGGQGLENENIETLFRDRDNLIWIGTKGGGLSALDSRKNRIQNMNHIFSTNLNKKLRVISINQDGEGMIWVGTWNSGLYVIDPLKEELIHHYKSNSPIYNILVDQYKNVWYLNGRQLFKFDPSESRMLRFPTSNTFYNMVEDVHRNKIWLIGNQDSKVALSNFDYEDQKLKEVPISIEARFVKSIALDAKNRLWFGSWGDGLFISDSEVKNFKRVNTNPQGAEVNNINYSIIMSIDIDDNGIAWLGTSQGGVLILYPNKGFEIARNASDQQISDRNITTFFKDSDGVSYKGTLMEGLYSDNKSASYSWVKSIEKTRINCVFEKGNHLFIGTGKGLYVIKNRDFENPKHLFRQQKITAILQDSKNRLWLGTQQYGLKMTDLESDPELKGWTIFSETEINHTLTNNRISQIKEDKYGKIWLGTYSGINLFDEKRQNFISQNELHVKDLSAIIINDLFFQGDTCYLATPTGLISLKNSKDKLEIIDSFNRSSGLSNDFICAVEQDSKGNLWLSTMTSITRFKPEDKTFVNFDREDGVMIDSFHSGASFVDDEGKIYFGGSNGLISFDPQLISDDFTVPEVILTRLTVNNKSLNVGDQVDGKVILENSIHNTEEIDLGYSQNHLSLTFTVNDFFGPENIFYSYQVKGMNDSWMNLGTVNQLSFTGLQHGEYEILLRASRNNIDWSPVKSLKIHIATPPWLTGMAFILYFILVIGIILIIRYISVRQARLKAELRIIQIEKEKEHELNEAKITFFTNISHEFRTPLTLILSPVTELIERNDLKEIIKEKLLLVESNAKRMLKLINQLLDFRKSEHGLLLLKVTRSNFIDLSREVYLSFKSLAIRKNIEFTFETELEELYFDFDRNQMEIVLMNLLSNAFKYTKEEGKIHVRINLKEKDLIMTVEDSGIGMSKIESEKIFDRFYQVQNSETSNLVGSGIGLAFSKNIVDLHQGEISVESEEGNGTCIRIVLPVIQTIQKPSRNELVEELGGQLSGELDLEDKQLLKITSTKKEFSIVIADDSEDIRTYLKSLLCEEYDVMEAVDGQKALELVQKELPDLVISDVMMPNMDGIRLCHEIKNQINTSHIPVILLTARASLTYEMDGLQEGADDYITKPFNPGIVKTRIQNILANRKILREHFLNKVRFEPESTTVSDNNLDSLFIEKAITLVNDNLQNEGFGIEVMVDELNMSQSTLFRKIKALTGLSLTGFIRSVKLKHAAKMILQSDIKLSQVAFEVGFNDYKYFTKCFQQQFECLPSEYRQKILQKA
ncbi:hybrid sensor histidine kinase/response regulator transcription factor [Algoriphagus yeomjeoni]|uniref:histidine kinase n=1 Tax=Algoriphagus yeomjeoni TaxID=291403 RepID=A0A327PII8_9BACT|nr:hybrid sensor histidine kinase/response regulator transcription factor [Algoriphagus yeomjeoni]RAI92089.1 signal transduction histidine kinase [Algoriphagus yeomjeoni]